MGERKILTMKILNFGSLNLDYIFRVPHFVTPGETLSADSLAVFPGGKGLNQSIALARACACVFHGGCYGEGGEPLVSLLAENGVNVSLLEKADAVQGSAMICVAPDGANTIVLSAGSNACVTEEQVAAALEEFEEGDWLLLQNEINNPERLIEKAYEMGMKIILNPSPFNEKLAAADFSKLAWLIVNETEAQQVSGKTDPKEVFEIIHQQYPALSLVLTLGEEGSIAWQVQEREITVCHQAAFRVSAVDTTGAGDTFTGYYVQALMAGMPLETCMKRAAAAAALSVTKPSAAASIPSRQEVEAFLENERGRI